MPDLEDVAAQSACKRMAAVTMMRIILVSIVGATLLGLCLGQEGCTTEEFIAGLSKIECTQMHREAVFDVFTQCGRDDLAEDLVDNCRTTKNVTCNELSLLIPFRNPMEIRSCYSDDTFDELILPCTAECREDLEVYVDDILGCCSRNMLEDELILKIPSVALISLLIDMCNVSLLRQDRCTTPSTLRYTPSGAVEPSCTTNEVSRRLDELTCNPAYLEPRIALAKSCGFPANEEPALACEEDGDGVICISYSADSTALDQVELNCIDGANDCTKECHAAVLSFRENLGCCVNNLFNHSFHSIYAASYELWSQCGIETVGVCGSESGASVQAPAADITKLLFAIAFLGLAIVL